jgi:hypothetical protein
MPPFGALGWREMRNYGDVNSISEIKDEYSRKAGSLQELFGNRENRCYILIVIID